MFSGFVDAAIQGGVVRRIKNGTETKWLLYAQIVTAIGLFMTVFTQSIFWAGLSLCVFTAGNALQEQQSFRSQQKNLVEAMVQQQGCLIRWIT